MKIDFTASVILCRIMGGNRHRKQGKKHQAPQSRNLRLVGEDGEMYAVFTKLFGGANAEVRCSDGAVRRCIIRSKFRGRHRRDNRVEPGVMCMVGLRLWESAGSAATVDLLHVYSADQKARLCREVAGDWSWMQEEAAHVDDASLFSFADSEVQDAAEELPDASSQVTEDQTEADIDVEDI